MYRQQAKNTPRKLDNFWRKDTDHPLRTMFSIKQTGHPFHESQLPFRR